MTPGEHDPKQCPVCRHYFTEDAERGKRKAAEAAAQTEEDKK